VAWDLQLEAEVSVALLALLETNPKAVRAILDALDRICALEDLGQPGVTSFGASTVVYRLVTHGQRVLFELDGTVIRAYYVGPIGA
jgi:hypothetical protein